MHVYLCILIDASNQGVTVMFVTQGSRIQCCSNDVGPDNSASSQCVNKVPGNSDVMCHNDNCICGSLFACSRVA